MSSSEDEHSDDSHSGSGRRTKTPSPFYLPLNVAFYAFLGSNAIAAAYAPIQDCDEIFNYWEPTHYLDHGYGLQTWEYSPEYSIRSWLYVSLHAAVGMITKIWSSNKKTQFYVIRAALAFVCAACETRLYSAISRTLNKRIGLLFLIITVFSPGFFHASAAFLPSTFTMYTSMLGLTAFLDRSGKNKIAEGIMWFGIGAIVGWPFSGALLLPLLTEEVLSSIFSGHLGNTLRQIVNGGIRCIVILGLEIGVDSLFFQKFAFVPWNIVAYNVFGGEGRGPNIFGTEPWTFYIRNLLLNFNVWFILAASIAPLLILQALFGGRASSSQAVLRSLAFVSPFYLWQAIFTVQPHKEERFMYPAYPFLALNAALALHLILAYVGTNKPDTLMGLIPGKVKFMAVAAFMLLSINAGLLRSVGMMTAYGAPLKVYDALDTPGLAQDGDFLCLGKEWYRFPSSFFLPQSMRAKFVKSEFSGLLPGEFPEGASMQTLLAGTSAIPTGMNDRNEEDLSKYVDISQCTFLVDSYFPSRPSTDLELDYIHNQEDWEVLACHQFLDVSETATLGRVLWIPNLPFVPSRFRRHWGDYCLLRRRQASS
ncbi:mannosyltransferase [Talaromyces marneffei ATCC 18224]|uniref:Mannosyltransferase n=2 Tax=Talaromyces marneffei TaxID=37727 RepID=B6QC96_TALMQ|nr:uncharacterized protein EYB26_002859 [Talaromyces marneffei]EEA25590.1 alpha-1,2-mannosyltransferase (Alg9), putative [Talaromyces marneffei ATCC 18224]KAE8554308.1 hypothetical protein EYB25_002846 [Talaromyces marneffei]QGA15203.1 hypothetical protein EYB26_002859 [Talaromyces marneffei]